MLAAMMLDAAACAEGSRILTPEAFDRPAYGNVFRALCAMAERHVPPDLVTVCNELQRRGELDLSGGPHAIALLLDSAHTTANLAHHARIVRETAARREAVRALDNASEAVRSGASGLPDALERLQAAVKRATAGLEVSREVDELARLALAGPAFMAEAFTQPRPLLGDSMLCEGGGAFLHAPGGEGKSFLGEQFAYAMSSGTSWLGHFSAPEGGVPVVLIQAELSSYHVQARRRSDPIYRESPPNLYTLTYERIGRQLDILQANERDKIVALIQQVGARVLVLDPLSQFHSEEESPAGFKLVRTAVQDIQLRTGASVFLVHHEVKVTDAKNPRPSQARARGATILTEDWAELGMALEKDAAGHHRLHFDKCRHCAKPSDVYVKQGPHGWWDPTSAPVPMGDKTTAALERALLTAGDAGATLQQLIAASTRDGGAHTDKAVNDGLNRIARKHGFDDRQGLNIGSEKRPRYVMATRTGSLPEVQADFGFSSDDIARGSDDSGF